MVVTAVNIPTQLSSCRVTLGRIVCHTKCHAGPSVPGSAELYEMMTLDIPSRNTAYVVHRTLRFTKDNFIMCADLSRVLGEHLLKIVWSD